MPALFAYLLAVGLLLGGGYGALSWLAAPEPVKVVVKAKPKPPRDEASSEATSFETRTSSLAINHRDHAVSGASGASDPPSPARSEARVAASEQGAQPQSSEPASAQQSRFEAEISSARAQQEVGQPALAVLPVSASNAQAAATSPGAAATAARPVKRPRARPASGGHSEKSRLALMTLRTIEFPDGRRITQLIPYRNGGRLLAFQPDD
jgi:hypothetical protein